MKLPKNPAPIFRSRTSTRFLMAVALSGPISVPKLAELLRIGRPHVLGLAAHYELKGLVVLNAPLSRPRIVGLNRGHYLYYELRALLFRLASRRPKRERSKPVAKQVDGMETLSSLFGTKGRTLSIAWIARLGAVNATDLRKIVQVGDQSIQVVIRYWKGLGFISSRRLGGERIVALDPNHPAGSQMRSLLARLSDKLPDARGLSHLQTHKLEKRKKLSKSTRPESAAAALPLGTATQRELLALLATQGDLPVSAIARSLDWTQDRVRGVLFSLSQNGVVRTARVPGDRNGSLWVSVGGQSPVEQFLRKVTFGYARPKLAAHQLPLLQPQFRKPQCSTKLFGPLLQRKVLVALASGVDIEDIEIADVVGSSPKFVRRALEQLAASGFVLWRPVGGRVKARLNRKHPALAELYLYLRSTGVTLRS